ncbi:zinc finger, CCHC-type containing protein [Tanacetum coccineum]
MAAAAMSVRHKGMYDPLFDIYQNIKSRKELCNSLEAKYMAEDASSKKFLEELTLVELGSHLRIKESLRAQDNDKPKGNNVAGPQIESRVLGFYVIQPNESVSIISIIESRDAIFDENIFSSFPRPSRRSLINGTKDIGSSVVPQVVTKEVVTQQHELELRKGKRNRTPKNFGLEFQLYLIEGTRDEVSDQHFYCFNVEDDPNTFDEAITSQDVAFWKEAINDEMDSIMGNNTWVLADLPLGCKPLGCKWIFKIKLKVDGTIERFKARLVIQGFRHKSGIDYFDTYASLAHISTIRLLIAMASIHNLIIH